jgi:heme/copper-type cytochrome/quinol oxidase subunit 2
MVRRFGNVVILCVTVAYCSRQVAIAVQAFAGKTSLADLKLGFFANITMVYTLSLAVSGISVVLYLNERRLHRKSRERLTERITKLELTLDPSRTSSHLTSRGLTRREDA